VKYTGLVRTQYWNVGSTNPTPRTGPTSRAESRTDVEGYLLAADAARNAALLGWGVAAGLRVSGVAGSAGVTVAVGVALDINGHVVVLAEGGIAVVDPQVGPGGVQNIPTVPVAAAGVTLETADLTGDLLLTLTWREVEEATGGLLRLHQAPWLRLVDRTTFAEDGLQLVLAAVTLGTDGAVNAVQPGTRRLAGIAAGRLELRLPSASAGSPLTVEQQSAGEVRLTEDGELTVNLLPAAGPATQVLGADAAASTLALLPAGGNVGIGLHGAPPRRTLHVEGSEVHSGGPGGGYSFASRDTGSYVATPANGERWSWYAADGAARLWSGSDLLTIRPQTGGLRVEAGDGGSTLVLAGQDSNLSRLALGADTITTRRPDGTESIVLDTTNARIGIGTAIPAHAVDITANAGLRQNRLHLSGNTGWSSLSYNAFHDDSNRNWVFPDPSRPAVTVEMDDFDGTPRFGVFTTTSASTDSWQLRLGADGNTGTVTIPASLTVGGGATFGGVLPPGAVNSRSSVQVKSMTTLDEGATASGAWSNVGSNAFYNGSWNRVDPARAGVNLHMNADGNGQEFRFLRMEPDGSTLRNIAVLGSATSFILESKLGVGTSQPRARLTVDDPTANDDWNTAAFRKPALGPNWSHIHHGPMGDWYIRSASSNGKVIIQDVGGRVGIGTSSPDLPLTVNAGARFSGVVTGAAAPGVDYAFAYETVGVSHPAMNLRLQSPNAIIFHAGGNRPGETASIDGGSNFTVNRIGTSGRSPAPAHSDWGGGIHTWDVEAHGTIWCENDTISNGVMYSGRGFRTGTADVAELFEGAEAVEPGDVVCLDLNEDRIVVSNTANDPAVLGVASTAPGLVLNAANTAEGGADSKNAVAVALCGRVPCRVTTENGPISRGDLLVASTTHGHAMRAGTHPVAGTLLGKALGTLDQGTGTIDVLVTLA
jgi:hypothetical protein